MIGNMVYAAVKPETPDIAYAIFTDDPECKDKTAALVADLIKEGGYVVRVTHAVGCQMFDKYLASFPKLESLPDEN